MVFTNTYVFTYMVNCSALTNDDVTCFCKLTTINLNTKSLYFPIHDRSLSYQLLSYVPFSSNFSVN